MLAQAGLLVCNQGKKPTFERETASSIVDVTFATDGLAAEIVNSWKVEEQESLSDHKYVTYNTGTTKKIQVSETRSEKTGWAIRKMNPEKFKAEMTREMQNRPREWVNDTKTSTPEEEAETLRARIADACDKSTPRRRGPGKNRPAYWWNEGVAEERKACNEARRRLQRARQAQAIRPSEARNEEMKTAAEPAKAARKALRTEIAKSKEKAWLELLNEVEADPWGKPYRICVGKIRRKMTPQTEETEEAVRKLFPEGEQVTREQVEQGRPSGTDPQAEATTTAPPITEAETKNAIKAMKSGKAPGGDGIPNEAIKAAYACDPEAFRRLYNVCLEHRRLPEEWKTAKLVLLPKGKPDKENGKQAYRPLCLLNGLAKGLERIIVGRIEAHLEETNNLSPNQYGFRKRRSTEDAINALVGTVRQQLEGKGMCTAVCIDIKNAFNTARWPEIIAAMKRKNVPHYLVQMVGNYLSNRTIKYVTPEGERRRWRQGGCRKAPS